MHLHPCGISYAAVLLYLVFTECGNKPQLVSQGCNAVSMCCAKQLRCLHSLHGQVYAAEALRHALGQNISLRNLESPRLGRRHPLGCTLQKLGDSGILAVCNWLLSSPGSAIKSTAAETSRITPTARPSLCSPGVAAGHLLYQPVKSAISWLNKPNMQLFASRLCAWHGVVHECAKLIVVGWRIHACLLLYQHDVGHAAKRL